MKGLTRAARVLAAAWCLVGCVGPATATDTFRVATYNVENYLDTNSGSRRVKSAAARAKVRDSLLELQPDVVALQEMGSRATLRELQGSLADHGLDLPHAEWIGAWDTNIHVAVLSRFPFVRRVPHTNEVYLLGGRRLHVSRGFAELEIKVNPDYRFTLLVAHLKSKRPVGIADEAEMRLEEARILRRLVDQRLLQAPNANLLVCGDFNDDYATPPVRTLVGRGRRALHDVRPAERNGDDHANPQNPNWFPRNIAWTHHYGAEDVYSRIDYILVSPGMARELDRARTFVLRTANWGLGSDHRPILATFEALDR